MWGGWNETYMDGEGVWPWDRQWQAEMWVKGTCMSLGSNVVFKAVIHPIG